MTPFAIIGTQRSGTTYLRRSLHYHRDIICHGEPFNPDVEGILEAPVRKGAMPSREQRDADPIGFLDHLMAFHTSGLAGFKLLLAHSPPVLNEIAARGYRLIVLRRENALARYSSIQILMAMQRLGQDFDRPANQGPSAIKAIFDPAGFEDYIETDDARWTAFMDILDLHSPPFIELEYRELVWGDGRERVLDFLGAARRSLMTGVKKLNSTDVVSRFANPDVVKDYLSERGLTRWEQEGPPGQG